MTTDELRDKTLKKLLSAWDELVKNYGVTMLDSKSGCPIDIEDICFNYPCDPPEEPIYDTPCEKRNQRGVSNPECSECEYAFSCPYA
jgi:hypothetical protein